MNYLKDNKRLFYIYELNIPFSQASHFCSRIKPRVFPSIDRLKRRSIHHTLFWVFNLLGLCVSVIFLDMQMMRAVHRLTNPGSGRHSCRDEVYDRILCS